MATGDYTQRRELYQFEMISHGNYTCGIYQFTEGFFPLPFVFHTRTDKILIVWSYTMPYICSHVSLQYITYENTLFLLNDQCLLFLNSLCLILATGDYTQRRELYQFETISHGNYTCGIDFPSVIFIYFWQDLSHLTYRLRCISLAVNMAKFGNVNINEFISAQCL